MDVVLKLGEIEILTCKEERMEGSIVMLKKTSREKSVSATKASPLRLRKEFAFVGLTKKNDKPNRRHKEMDWVKIDLFLYLI